MLFVKSCCIWAIVVVFGQIWLYSGNVVVFRQKWLYSGKVVVVGQSSFIRPIGFIRAKWFSSCRNVCLRAKVVVFGQKLLYSGKVVVFG